MLHPTIQQYIYTTKTNGQIPKIKLILDQNNVQQLIWLQVLTILQLITSLLHESSTELYWKFIRNPLQKTQKKDYTGIYANCLLTYTLLFFNHTVIKPDWLIDWLIDTQVRTPSEYVTVKPGFHYPSWRVTGFHYPSTRAVLTGARFH